MDGLQQRAVVQTQVEVRGHPGSERAFPPLILSQVHSPYEGQPVDQQLLDAC